MSGARTSWPDRSPLGRRGVRASLLLAVLVPLVGLIGVASFEIRHRWDSRQASSTLDADAVELARMAEFLALLAREEVYANVVALGDDIGLSADDVETRTMRTRLDVARGDVDSRHFAELRHQAGIEERLQALRDDLDAGSLGFADVRRRFTAVDEVVQGVWEQGISRVEQTADEARSLPPELRDRIGAVREAMRTFASASERIQASVAVLLGPVRTDDVRLLLESSRAFELVQVEAQALAGIRAAARWDQFLGAPAVERTERTVDLAVAIALGDAPPLDELDREIWLQGLEDGAVWATRLSDVVRAAAHDLQEAAAEQAAADTRAVVLHASVVAAAAAVSVLVAVAIARRVARAAGTLEQAARRIEGGEFDMPALEPDGPRELAATVRAFNDMASTLAAVEDHTVALAEDPRSPVLDEPLPGRTGQAMQRAIDRLRRSIHDAEVHRAELYELATHDALTGLLNRSAAFASIDRELARAARAGEQLLALYIDLDGLKPLNDSHGHEVGDDAIVRTALALRATTRAADIVARLGGDEFLVVGPLPPDGRDGAVAFAERIRSAVSEQEVRIDADTTFPLRCSIGVVAAGPAERTAADLVRAADAAMYRAKHAGRDQVAWLGDPDDAAEAETQPV